MVKEFDFCTVSLPMDAKLNPDHLECRYRQSQTDRFSFLCICQGFTFYEVEFRLYDYTIFASKWTLFK